MPPRVLVVGPSAGLAEEFVRTAPAEWTFEGVGRQGARLAADRFETMHAADATDIGPLEFAVRANPCDTVVSFVQETNRALCQEERPLPGEAPAGRAWTVNVEATEAIARAALSEHKRLVVLSTDEIFPELSGPAAEPATPLAPDENPSWYGGTWAEAEARLRRLVGTVAIVRVSALFGWPPDVACGDRALAGLLHAPTSVVQPSYVPDVIRVLRRLVEEPRSGTFHVGLAGPVSLDDLRRALKRTPGSLRATVVPERHPGLVPGRIEELGVRPTPWQVAAASVTTRAP